MFKCPHCEQYETPIEANLRLHLAARHPEAFAEVAQAEANADANLLILAQRQAAEAVFSPPVVRETPEVKAAAIKAAAVAKKNKE